MDDIGDNTAWQKFNDMREKEWFEFIYRTSSLLEIFADIEKVDIEIIRYIHYLRHLIHWELRFDMEFTKQVLDTLDELINKLEASQAPKSYQYAVNMRDKIIQSSSEEDPSS